MRLKGSKTKVIGTRNCNFCNTEYEYKKPNSMYCSNACRCKVYWPKTKLLDKDQYQRLVYNLRKRDPTSTLVKEDLERLYQEQNGLCALTGFKLQYVRHQGKGCNQANLFNTSVDRIDQTKGYTLDNIRLVCFHANMIRGSLSDEQLLEWCYAISIQTNAQKEVRRKKKEAKK